MPMKYLELTVTEAVCRAQTKYYGRAAMITDAHERDSLTEAEADFIVARDSFYLGTVSDNGWPYIQHRGGPVGFLRVLNPTTLAFADYHGNRQLLSTGNISSDDRVALFLMDYKKRERLKILGHARVEDARDHPELIEQLPEPSFQARTGRIFFINVASFDWNCPKYITPKYSIGEVEELAGPLKARIAELEEQLRTVNKTGVRL